MIKLYYSFLKSFPLKIHSYKLNEIGGRANLEDAICPQNYSQQALPVFVVCDGVGGSSFGEIASDIASKTFHEILTKEYQHIATKFDQLLLRALEVFKEKIKAFIETNPAAEGTSTTLTIVVLKDGKAYIAWCGDSKIYHIRDGKTLYKSKDHSLVHELVLQGIITEEQALTHPQRNVITRSISINTKQTDIEHTVLNNVQEGDWLLQCTDGLLEQFTEQAFPALLTKFEPNKEYATIIKNICLNKTKDNFSMYLLNIQGGSSKAKTFLLSTFITIVIAAAGYWAYTEYFMPKEVVAPVTDQSPSLLIQEVKVLPKKDTTINLDSLAKDSIIRKEAENKLLEKK